MQFDRRNVASLIFTKSSLIFFVLIICLYVILRLWQLATYELWYDEVFSLNVARLGWSEIVPFVVRDIVHPPLFYLLLKLWINVGGESLFWLRLFPALTSIAAIVPLFLLCRELKLKTYEINTALLLIAVNGYLIYYAQELRMYSLLLFLTLTSIWLFARIINSEKESNARQKLLLFVNILLIYTQYFGWLVIGAQFIYVVIWKRQKIFAFTITNAALAFSFVPWVLLVSQAVADRQGLSENLGWLQQPSLSELIWYYATLHGTFDVPRTTMLGLLIFWIPLLFLSWQILKSKGEENETRRKIYWMLVLFSFVPVMLAFISSQILPQSVWGTRYLIVSAVPYLLLVSVGARQLTNLWSRSIFTALIIGWATVSSISMLIRDDRKIHWNKIASTIKQAELSQATKVKVYTFEEWLAAPLRFTLESGNRQQIDVVVIKDVAEINEAHFWLAFRNTTWKKESLPQNLLGAAGCRAGEELHLNDESQKVILFSADCDK